MPSTPLHQARCSGAADKWREVVSSVENLSEHAKPDETEAARLALREIIGEVSVVEQGARVLAYAKLNTAVVHNSGAENAAPDLYLKPITLKQVRPRLPVHRSSAEQIPNLELSLVKSMLTL